MLKVSAWGLGGLGISSFGSTALGVSDGYQLELAATWVSLIAAIACLGRSPIHVFWGKYLTRHPDGRPRHRWALRELNCLVPANVVLSLIWIVIAASQLSAKAPQPPLFVAIIVPCAIVLVAMETVRCVGVTKKRRGTEIVCEGPVGKWFREFFETSDEETGPVHKVMVFFRHPNGRGLVSRFLCLLTGLMFIPVPVHSSATAGTHLNDAIVTPPAPVGSGEPAPRRRRETSDVAGEENGAEDEPEPKACGTYDGRPAPAPEREEIVAVFEEAGVGQTGCPEAPEEVGDHSEVWIASARCGTELRSLVTTGPEYLPALLYQQAAGFARARGREGVLLGASDRHPVRGGDFYVVDTTMGSYVLIRRRPSNGERGGENQDSSSSPCEAPSEGNFLYTVVPPGLIALWLEAVEEGAWLFPVSDSANVNGGTFEFLADYPAREALAHASCANALECMLRVDGETRRSSGTPTYVSVAEITSLAWSTE